MGDCNVNDGKPNAIVDPREAIEIVAGDNIRVDKTVTSSKVSYKINYVPYAPPVITVGVDVSTQEVGAMVAAANFSGSITKGSLDILARSMVPDKALDLTSPFNWVENNVQGNDAGLFPQFNGTPLEISATDSQGTVNKQAGIPFKWRFYMGFSTKDTLAESEIKALVNGDLLNNIHDKYKEFTYHKNDITYYIYWAYPVGTQAITGAEEGPLPVPLKLDLPNVNITNVNGVSKSYRVVRTATRSKYVNALITLL